MTTKRNSFGSRLTAVVTVLALSPALGRWAFAADYALREETVLTVTVDPLLVEDGRTRSLGPRVLEIGSDGEGSLAADLDASPAWNPLRLVLDAKGHPGPPGGPHEIALRAVVTLPGGTDLRSARTLTLTEGSSGLFEVLGQDRRHVVLSLSAERGSRPVLAGAKSAGPAVLFRLEVDRREGDVFIPLESNRLSTFLGEGVEYSFRSGAGGSLESVHVVLTPVRIEGDVADVEIDLTSALPGGSSSSLLARKETLITTRGATSSVVVSAGEPPVGYRFRVTPFF